MKNILFITLLFITLSCAASGSDSLFHRHQFTMSLGNGMSDEFFDNPNHRPTAVYKIDNDFEDIYDKGLPLYAMHIQTGYSLGISHLIRIETGIGYLLNSFFVKNSVSPYDPPIIYTYNYYGYVGNLTIPLHIKFTKPTRRGAFTCTLGPDFLLPVHEFYRIRDFSTEPAFLNESGHEKYTSKETSQLSSMGMYLKMGYEKQLSHHTSVNIGPAVDFFDLVQFHSANNPSNLPGYHLYQYYVGFDLAFSFGFRK